MKIKIHSSLMARVLCVAITAMMIVTMIVPMSAAAAPATSVTTSVLSPWGEINPPVNMPLAPRLSDLDNAAVGIIYFDRLGGLDFANAIETNLKAAGDGLTVEKIKLDQIRLTPKETGHTETWFDGKAAEYDAVVIDVADTTNTAYWAAIYTREFESRGVPTVVVTTSNFLPVLNVSAEAHGITALRSVVIPNDLYAQAFRGMATRSVSIIDSEGYGDALRAALTTPLTSGEINPPPIIAPHQEPQYTLPVLRSEYHLLQFFLEFSMQEGFGDGLPLTLPTREAVDAMLAGTTRAPDEVLGTLRLRYGIMTVEKVAVNAVMAGADPKYFPVILAAMEAIIDGIEDDSLFHYAWTSGDDYSLLILVNGPIADELGFYAERSFTQTARDAQLTIGRAVRLAFQNIGHNTRGDVNTGRTGAVADHAGSVMAENTLQFPGSIDARVYQWEPHHVSMGFNEGDSVVTIAAVGRWAEMQQTVPGWFTQDLNSYMLQPGHFMLRDKRIHDYATTGGSSLSPSQGYDVMTFATLPVNPVSSGDFTMITYNPDNISMILEAPETNGGTSTGEVDYGRTYASGAQLSVKLGLGSKQGIKNWYVTHGIRAGQATGGSASGSLSMTNTTTPAIPFAAHANVVHPIVSGEHPAYARVLQSKFLGMDAARSQLVANATITTAGKTLGVPSQPKNFKVMGGEGNALLSWDAPDRLGTLVRYEVSKDGGFTWVDVGVATSYNFTGLENAIPYDFAVRAINDVRTAAVIDNDTYDLLDRGSGRGAQAMVRAVLGVSVYITGPATVTASAGATATYTVSVENAPDVTAAQLTVKVDGDFFETNSYAGIGGFFGVGNLAWTDNGDGTWSGEIVLAGEATGDFNVFEITFNLKGLLGTTVVELEDFKIAYDGKWISFDYGADTVTTTIVKWYSQYDVNHDEVIDLRDISYAMMFYMAQNGDANWAEASVCDVNGDGIVDIEDLILIRANFT